MKTGTIILGILIAVVIIAFAAMSAIKGEKKKKPASGGGGGGYTEKPKDDIDTEQTPDEKHKPE